MTTKRVQLKGENTEFTEAALEFPQTVVFAAELLRITPEFLRPLVYTMPMLRIIDC